MECNVDTRARQKSRDSGEIRISNVKKEMMGEE